MDRRLVGRGGVSLGLTGFTSISLGLVWTLLDPLGLTWTRLVSLALTWSHLDLLGLTWTHFDSLGLTWCHLDSLGLTWTYLDSLLDLTKEKRKIPTHKRQRERVDAEFYLIPTRHPDRANARTPERQDRKRFPGLTHPPPNLRF